MIFLDQPLEVGIFFRSVHRSRKFSNHHFFPNVFLDIFLLKGHGHAILAPLNVQTQLGMDKVSYR